MMTPAELFKEILKPDGQPDRQLKQYEALHIIFANPLDQYLRGNRAPGTESIDRWGTTIVFPENAPGAMPHITPENKVCPDITHWRDYCHAPDLLANCSDGWEAARKHAEKIHADGELVALLMGTGIFEQLHFLMGFEDTLTGFYEHPAEMHELINYILEYRLTYARIAAEQLHPDAIISHDDWGTKDSLFMKPEIWREFFKEPYRKFYRYFHEQNIIAVHHADSYLVPIVEDMAEIGIQCWQGVLPENNIPLLQEKLHGRMVLMGGIGAAIDREDAEEPEIRTYVRNALDSYCPRGHFIPCITYGAPGTVYSHVDGFINAEIEQWNQELHVTTYRPVQAVRRAQKTAAVPVAQFSDWQGHAATAEAQAGQAQLLDKISLAVQKGQNAKIRKLCAEALENGFSAEIILSDGLVRGMSALGDAFSAGKAFVPEMLIAARCMNTATTYLKPYMVQSQNAAAGRVCLGTVRGDMHDIGKNLVKIMLEGSGLDVIDLGNDVPAETFVQTAIDQKCDIIACSALLTTTMQEMRKVVELTNAAQIRDQLIIMIGGAPITQEFCDEIGADIYTKDAASCARAAVKALSEKR